MNTHLNSYELNQAYQPLDVKERIAALYDHFQEEQVLLTSSFGIHSALLLYLMHDICSTQPVYFINTSFHFEETLNYMEYMKRLLNLQVIELKPPAKIHELTVRGQLWENKPNVCCHLNKVKPLYKVKSRHKIWVSGIMANQTANRSRFSIFEEPGPGDVLWKFNPLIDLTLTEYETFRQKLKLPHHPLEKKGYGSVGCRYCTVPANNRRGRWKGNDKTECGLHTQNYPNKMSKK